MLVLHVVYHIISCHALITRTFAPSIVTLIDTKGKFVIRAKYRRSELMSYMVSEMEGGFGACRFPSFEVLIPRTA